MNHCTSWRRIFIYFFIAYVSAVSAQIEFAQSVVALENGIVQEQKINALFSDNVQVGKVTYDSDCFLQEQEFSYLVGFVSGDVIKASDITAAVELFAKKNKFTEIKVDVAPGENGVS